MGLAMRYGSPSIKQGIKSLVDQGVDEIMLIPLYPQFAMATTETILVLAEKIKNEKYPELEFTVLPPFTTIRTISGCFLKAFKKI